MPERSQISYPLLQQFREFYEEVARLRRVVESAAYNGDFVSLPKGGVIVDEAAAAQPSLDRATQPSGGVLTLTGSVHPAVVRVWHEMALYLDQKLYEVRLAANSLSHGYLEELVYLMAAFADETFVCLVDWPGKEYWSEHWMELRLFHSQIAGEDIFRRIDKILTVQDYGAEELAAIYLMALALGFRGKYLRNPAAVDSYRRKLFDRLLMTNPYLRRDSLRLFPEAYRHTITEGAPVRLPEPRKWWLLVAGIVGIWLVLSTVAWLVLTHSTQKNLHATMRSLKKVRDRQFALGTSNKWSTLAFTLQDGAYCLELPASLPLVAAGSPGAGSVVAPFIIAVNGPGGYSPGTAAQVESWLSRGSISFPANLEGVVQKHRTLASVEPMQSSPTGVMAPSTTLFVWVDPALSAQELALHPQLTFPANGMNGQGYGVSVVAVSLYLPAQSVAGAP
jgi:type VI secretion system protein ImpK